ncbi:GIY-YIG nuclease family protein [Ideonella margarita]|uniref:GIY-YIG nuclease family protein n=1 Tax=Ideonella margarita TaxID=2984191 RepID=UPI003BF9DBD2
MPSWVYIITNEAAPGLLKVGFTDRTPEQRASELGATGLPLPYAVVFALEVEDGRVIERVAHKNLAQFHVGKEWFSCPIETARDAIESAAGFGCDESHLVPGHALAPYFSGRSAPPRRQSPREALAPPHEQDEDDSPYPPGHPLRGML